MSLTDDAKVSFSAALPIVLGYIGIGIPCGIMESQIGINALMAFVVSMTFYSGAGQFMVPGMWLAGQTIPSIVASVSFVNTRQILYSTAFAPYFDKAKRLVTFLFSATVTDESFGVNLAKFQSPVAEWTPRRATLVNLFCMTSWSLANAAGVLLGSAVEIPTAIAAFAMTSIFICLLMGQASSRVNHVVIIATFVAVIVFKSIGLTQPAILLGAICGVIVGCLYKGKMER